MTLIKDMESRMDKSIDAYEENLAAIRAGRANPKLVEDITFSYYGVETPIKQAATISTPEARLLVIQPWDVSNIKPIEKAILQSDLGITPGNDGKIIRLPFPQLTEERRKDLVKDVKKKSEEAKVAIRNIRRDAMDEIKSMEKSGEWTEDDRKSTEADVQKVTDKFTEKIDKISKKKEDELLEI